MEPQNARTRKIIAIVLIVFPLGMVFLTRAFGIGSMLWAGCARAHSPKSKSITSFVEQFNGELVSQGYRIDLSKAHWERTAPNPYELIVRIQNPLDRSLDCKLTVAEYDRPRVSLPVISLTLVETVLPQQADEASALPTLAQTIFTMFTPNYVQNPQEQYGFGYSYAVLWQKFTDALTQTEARQQPPYFPVPQRKDVSLHADVLLVDIQFTGEALVSSVSWFWE